MVATYATEAKVVSFLNLTSAKATELNTEIGYAIERAQDEIDRYTGSAFRSVTVTDEFHNLGPWIGNNGFKVRANHAQMKTLASGSGDKLEIWNGSAYEDYLTTKTSGRANDYWQEERDGIVWIRTGAPLNGGSEVRLTYRYGRTSVPADIERACVLLAATDLVTTDDRSVILPEGGGNSLPFVEKARIWRERAFEILNGYREFYPMEK